MIDFKGIFISTSERRRWWNARPAGICGKKSGLLNRVIHRMPRDVENLNVNRELARKAAKELSVRSRLAQKANRPNLPLSVQFERREKLLDLFRRKRL
ncbi:hypothetical protein EN871_08780 [bacterium M00.F.Ca.ET.228.01.1.1]|uniref:hypothetical protein n=1 Tax=Paraburkholderia phenoliruptrix TaxID=252970 RepID=UPI001091DE74|nr:hypothetical protein [Paraburkholderia phenoliruptrix]TGP44678.1 hypothetical protein EN871_08780 [bacterium M00.F.Ca.ET.228.01.1.1]TGS02561.1 hypothetical protein EN834_08775 [bacterium M00.F.Ca.ET.191.01.1.1]TGU05943.1 hypothetical protein EN798_12855 [bacterium M00.F.Ca.ET.155.01.1.1]MBW0450189.1 hypothetical protein [Paraburkholderia phenoliruptrix]MBW9099878.1 hypothetical protein [Paraburkholderia phenoliruptrix]